MGRRLNRWAAALKRAQQESGRKALNVVAGGVAFFALLALFPAIGAFVSVFGLIASPQLVQQQARMLEPLLPGNVLDLLTAQAAEVAGASAAGLTTGLAISVLLALWSSGKGMKALMAALNIAYGESEDRGFLKLNLQAVGLTALGIVIGVVAVLATAALPAVFGFLDGPLVALVRWLRWVVLALLIVAAFAVFYRYGPSREPPRVRGVVPGAVAATLLWTLASIGFSFYVANFASYGATFGSLAGAVILLLWFYISAYVICFGAEFNAQLEGKADAPEVPRGEEERAALEAGLLFGAALGELIGRRR